MTYLSLWPYGRYGGSDLFISSTATEIAGLMVKPGNCFQLVSPVLSLFPLKKPMVKTSQLPERVNFKEP